MEDVKVNELSSRTEKILGSMTGDYTGDLENPKSRVEALLLKLNKQVQESKNTSGGLKDVQYVDALPATGKEGTVYFVKKKNPKDSEDLYDEWVGTADGKFEHLGSTDVDLTDYITKEELQSAIKEVEKNSGISYAVNQDAELLEFFPKKIDGQDPDKVSLSRVATSGSYRDLKDKPEILTYKLSQGARDNYRIILEDSNGIQQSVTLSKVAGSGAFKDLSGLDRIDKDLPEFVSVAEMPSAPDVTKVYCIKGSSLYTNHYYKDSSWHEFTTATDLSKVTRLEATVILLAKE